MLAGARRPREGIFPTVGALSARSPVSCRQLRHFFWRNHLALRHDGFPMTYGAATSIVVVLIWVYYSAQLVLFGAEFTRVYAGRYGSER